MLRFGIFNFITFIYLFVCICPLCMFLKEKGVVFYLYLFSLFWMLCANQILKLEEHFKSHQNNWVVFCALLGEPVCRFHDLSSIPFVPYHSMINMMHKNVRRYKENSYTLLSSLSLQVRPTQHPFSSTYEWLQEEVPSFLPLTPSPLQVPCLVLSHVTF